MLPRSRIKTYTVVRLKVWRVYVFYMRSCVRAAAMMLAVVLAVLSRSIFVDEMPTFADEAVWYRKPAHHHVSRRSTNTIEYDKSGITLTPVQHEMTDIAANIVNSYVRFNGVVIIQWMEEPESGILGRAGPGPPAAIYINPNYIESMTNQHTFVAFLIHELFHVMGIGTWWTFESDHYTYDVGLIAYRKETGDVNATLFLEVGDKAHWKAGVATTTVRYGRTENFRTELLTPTLSAGAWLSATSVAALTDLNYTTNYCIDAADCGHLTTCGAPAFCINKRDCGYPKVCGGVSYHNNNNADATAVAVMFLVVGFMVVLAICSSYRSDGVHAK